MSSSARMTVAEAFRVLEQRAGVWPPPMWLAVCSRFKQNFGQDDLVIRAAFRALENAYRKKAGADGR